MIGQTLAMPLDVARRADRLHRRPMDLLPPHRVDGFGAGFGDDGVSEADGPGGHRMDEAQALELRLVAHERRFLDAQRSKHQVDVHFLAQNAQRLRQRLGFGRQAIEPGMDQRLNGVGQGDRAFGISQILGKRKLLEDERHAIRPIQQPVDQPRPGPASPPERARKLDHVFARQRPEVEHRVRARSGLRRRFGAAGHEQREPLLRICLRDHAKAKNALRIDQLQVVDDDERGGATLDRCKRVDEVAGDLRARRGRGPGAPGRKLLQHDRRGEWLHVADRPRRIRIPDVVGQRHRPERQALQNEGSHRPERRRAPLAVAREGQHAHSLPARLVDGGCGQSGLADTRLANERDGAAPLN